MAEYFSSLCCCSCCSSPSPSSPQSLQQPPLSHQQQPPHQQAISISSPQSPHQQAITGHSTPSSSSQPSEQEATMTDFKNFLQEFNDIRQIEVLIPFLEELWKIASGEKGDSGSNSAAGSCIQDGQRILEMLDKRIGKRPETKNSRDGAIAEIEKVFIEGLKGAEKIPTVGIALSMLGSVLSRFTQMSGNKSECLEVLRRMVDLGKKIMELNEQISDQKLNEAVQCIVVGTTMCISQLARANIFRFLTATVNAECLKEFQDKIDRLYSDIELSTVIRIGKRVPEIALSSQTLYEHKQTVGIESEQERVIQLLDLNAQDTKCIVVVVYGFGGIGKTTLADAVYAHLDLKSYKYCRIHMEQGCNNNDLKAYQQQILYELFKQNFQFNNCDDGRGMLCSYFKKNRDQPLFLYIDNGLISTDLEKLLPYDLDSCIPPKSRILITTRNLRETDIFVSQDFQRRELVVNPLPVAEARKLLLKKASNYNDENNIDNLLNLCGGVPLLLELAGSQLAINRGSTKNIVLEMLAEGEKVQERDISDCMVGFVYDRLLKPVQEAFLDIVSFFYNWDSQSVARIVGKDEFRALEAASFVKTSEYGFPIVHDIVRARGKKLSQENRITDPETLLDCLNDKEKLKKLKGIKFDGLKEQPSIEINCNHLNCMSNSLRVLYSNGSYLKFKEKCDKPFKQLRCIKLPTSPDLPIEFEKLEHLTYYHGPLTQNMNLYEFPPSLRSMGIYDRSENRVAYSKTPPKVTPASSLEILSLIGFKNMQRLPDGLEKLTKLENLMLQYDDQLKELPSNLKELGNLKELTLNYCKKLEKFPSDFGQLNNLTTLDISGCNALSALPSNFSQLKNLELLMLRCCSWLEELPSDFGQLKNLKKLDLSSCSNLKELPSDFGQLKNLKKLYLTSCSKLKELPSDFGQLKNLKELDLSYCKQLVKWPLSFGDLTEMEKINLSSCPLRKLLPDNIKGNKCKVTDFTKE